MILKIEFEKKKYFFENLESNCSMIHHQSAGSLSHFLLIVMLALIHKCLPSKKPMEKGKSTSTISELVVSPQVPTVINQSYSDIDYLPMKPARQYDSYLTTPNP